MARLARVVAVGVPHHITQRGNDRQDVFRTDVDRVRYLQLLAEHAGQWGVRLLGYCLMSNHVHLIAVPRSPESFARGIGRAHYRYTREYNLMNRRSGHLWQNRFYSCPLSDSHAATALRYVDLNPVRASMAERAEEYRWSSAAAHLGIVDWPHGLLDRRAWDELDLAAGWREYLDAKREQDEEMRLREATSTGRPFGDEEFVLALERKLARPLRPNPPGRPKARAASSNL